MKMELKRFQMGHGGTNKGVRLTPVDYQPVHCSNTFMMHVTSAETNVASISSFLGCPKVLTTFVKDSPIARMIKTTLPAGTWFMKVPNWNRVGRGLQASVQYSRQDTDQEARGYIMTVPERWADSM